MVKFTAVLLALTLLFSATRAAEESIAHCRIQKTELDTGGLSGVIKFYPDTIDPSTFVVDVDLAGVTGTHGIHVHTYGEVDLVSGGNLGGHFKVGDQVHDLPGTNRSRHIGDMGNFDADIDDTIKDTVTLDLLTLQGVDSILGRGVVVHAKEDLGYEGDPANGAAGSRFGVCVIGKGQVAEGNTNIASSAAAIDTVKATLKNTTNSYIVVTGSNSGESVSIKVMATGLTVGDHSWHLMETGEIGTDGNVAGEELASGTFLVGASNRACVSFTHAVTSVTELLGHGLVIKKGDTVLGSGVIGIPNPTVTLPDNSECVDVSDSSSSPGSSDGSSSSMGTTTTAPLLLLLVLLAFLAF